MRGNRLAATRLAGLRPSGGSLAGAQLENGGIQNKRDEMKAMAGRREMSLC